MHTVSKTTNTLENVLQMSRDVPKKEVEKIYTDPFFSTCTLLLLLIPCVSYSRTHWEHYSLEFQMYLYYWSWKVCPPSSLSSPLPIWVWICRSSGGDTCLSVEIAHLHSYQKYRYYSSSLIEEDASFILYNTIALSFVTMPLHCLYITYLCSNHT